MKKKKQRKEKQYFHNMNNKIKMMIRKHNHKDYLQLSVLCQVLHVHQEVVLKEPLKGYTIDCPDIVKIISFNQNTATYLFNDKKFNASCSSLLVKV